MGGSYDLQGILRNLRSNKITDRKKALSTLKGALQSPSTLASLDRNTLGKVNVTWDIIAANVIKTVDQELEKFAENAKKNKTSATAGTDLLSVASLLRTVVQSANRKQPLLNARKVLEHIREVLVDTGNPGAALVHPQYTRLLLLLLGANGWQPVLAANVYNELVDLVCGLLRQEDADVVGLSSTLHHLVATGFHQEDGRLENVFRTLAASFIKPRENVTVSKVGQQLATLVEVGRRLGGRRRNLLCSVGEPVARFLLVPFNWKSLQIKELSLEFLSLQLGLHRMEEEADEEEGHPGGSSWEGLLADWHELLMRQLQERSIGSTTSGQQEARVRKAQVWLAAETWHQLERRNALANAVAALLVLKPNHDALPWLEVLACYLWRYPETAKHASSSLRKLLDFLTQCYSSCKLQAVKRCIMLCYCSVARAHGPQPGTRPWPVWSLVWDQTVKTVFLNQCVEEGHLVLQELLRRGWACSDLTSLFCPGGGRSMELPALHSVAALLGSAGSMPHLDVPSMALLDSGRGEEDVPEKHRWRLWLLELLVPGEGAPPRAATLVPAGELLAALCLARPSIALAPAAWQPLLAWQDPYPWRSKLDADIEHRSTAQLLLGQEEAAKSDGAPTATAAVMELAWNAALDTLAKQCSAFLDAEDMLPACLYTACMGAILVARIWCLQGGEVELLASPLVKQLQGHLRECTEKLLQCSPPPGRQASSGGEQELPSWLGFLDALLSYVEGIPSGHHLWAWLLDALPQELDACLISTFREPSSDISSSFGPRPSGMGEQIDMGSDDEWVDENTPSSSLLHRGSVDGVGDMDADFDFVDSGQPASTEAATKQSLLSPERLTREDGHCLATLRLGLAHFCLSRRVGLGDGERTFAMLLQLVEGAKRNLTAWSVQSVLLVLRVLFERAELILESELFSLVDALRELMKVHCRQLDVSAALLDLARLCVPAVSRCDARSKARDCFLVILEAYAALQGSGSATQGVCNEGVSLAFLRLLFECSQEPWVVLKADKGRPVPVLEYAVRFLGSGHDSVRTLAAQNVGLFLRDPASLDALLPHLARHLAAVEVGKEDEHLAACLVFATALGNAGIALGPHLGARAAALLVHAVWDKHLLAPLVAKVLAQWKSEQPWSHLPTVVHHWLKQGLPLQDLPFEALGGVGGEAARPFLERHWQLVLPAAIECCSQEAVKFVGDTLGRPAKSLLAEVAPVALSRALPFGGDSAPALCFLETCLSREAVQRVMVERLPEVLVAVLQLACDWPDTHRGLAQLLYPPCLGDSAVNEALRLLKAKCSEDASLVDLLLQERDGLQLVLAGLEGSSSLAAVRHLVDLLAPYLSRAGGLRGSDCYALRTLTLRLLRRLPVLRSEAQVKSGVTISAEENRVVCLVARLLRRLYEAAGEHLYKEIERNLPVVVNALAPFVDENNIALAWEVQALVKVLVSDERLETAVLCVRPLPDVDHLASSQGSLLALRTRVRQGNFAQVLSSLTRSLREGLLSEDTCVLAALGDLLKQHRAELSGLLEGIQGKTFFSEETTSSPLHQLIVILFEQARSPNEEVRAASLRCLGLLGPVELGLPALGTAHWNPIRVGMVDDAAEGCSEVAYRMLLGRMHRYLSHPDPQLSGVACGALKRALSTRSGVAFASRHSRADMEDVFAFLHPFCSHKVCLLERPPGPADAEPWELWAPEGPCDHATWVRNLVCTLVRCTEDHFFWALLPLCEMETELCELLFPFVVETLADERAHWNAVVSGVAIFLERHAESRPRDDGQSQSTVNSEPVSVESAVASRVYCSRASVAVIMSAVERMLVRRQARASTLWDGLRLQVDLLKAAQAAEFCGNHVTAVQCVELWWDWQGRARESLSETEDSGAPLLHWSRGGREASTVQSVLLSSFSGLGDLDALTGCRCLALGGSARLLWRHCAEQRGGHWPTLLAQADLEAVGRNARLGHALKQCGLYHTLATYLQGTESPDLAELQAECAWRLADWDCRLPKGSDDTGFQRGIFTTLSSISSREAEGLHSGLGICRQLLSGQLLAMAQLGSAQELNQLLSKVQMCTVLEEGVALAMGEEEEAVLLKRWEERAAQPGFDFREPVSWLQGIMVGQLAKDGQAKAAQTAILGHYAVQARLNQYPWLARVALKELERCAPERGERWLLEEARIQLAQGDCTEAQHTLYTLLKQLGHHEGATGRDARAYAEVLQLYGECLAESRAENSDTIAQEYFAKAVDLLAGHTAEASLWTAHLRLARFADAQVQGIEQYLRSPEFQDKQNLLRQSSHILHCTPAAPTDGGDARALRLLERQSDLDRGEAASLQAAKNRHLLQAVSNYLQCLRGGHDLRLFRLASLWFGNSDVPEVNALLKDGLGKLESYKFVPLIYQLAARMSRSGNESTFAKLLHQLIERVVREHPYQTLPVVLALCNADKDPSEKGAAPRTKKARTSLPSEERVEGARSLVSHLRKGGGLCSAILPQLERLMDAYIQLAYLDPPSAPRGQPIACVKLPRDTPLLKLGQVDKIPVLTQDVPVDRGASYSNLPGILKFSPEYRLCGGINMPKVVTCVGQDGRSYKQLVKGRDDLRQDAVMQQAFGLVNRLLDQEKKGHTGGRLAMRTYKVVPLSRRSGLVQWCEGTQPFSEFLLTNNTGAHQRYQPNDWAPMACRKAMQAVHKSSPEERLQAYLEVCSHFHPVFRYFFFEHFPEPSRWFERRRAYVHSVATGSIVGYILGLGDRHCANILVDKHSAELIHIDLGVAFEQGRTLNTPETVPFRLTRDVVDGMGICGVEGTFRRCCERTMEVMRCSRELLVTVVEVLLHDPLSSWTLSPERAAALQADGSGGDDRRRSPTQEPLAAAAPQQHDQKNRLARRMLLRLEQKLQGLEEGAPLSVAGQVNLLIQQAIDPHNLSRLFPGWQPYV